MTNKRIRIGTEVFCELRNRNGCFVWTDCRWSANDRQQQGASAVASGAVRQDAERVHAALLIKDEEGGPAVAVRRIEEKAGVAPENIRKPAIEN